jgi:hypothetical protein
MRVTSANPTQMLRAPAARGARNKGCYFWTPKSLALVQSLLPPALRNRIQCAPGDAISQRTRIKLFKIVILQRRTVTQAKLLSHALRSACELDLYTQQ